MKRILFLIVLTFISCTPREDVEEVLGRLRQERYKKVLNCVKENNGSEALIKLFEENKNLKFGMSIKYNKDITKKDKEIFYNCRKKSVNLKTLKNEFYAKKNNGYISPEMLYNIFLFLGEPIKLKDIQSIFNENDSDDDGNLNFQDFKLLMRNGIDELHEKFSNFIGKTININNNNNNHH